jgi:hypothetical protein
MLTSGSLFDFAGGRLRNRLCEMVRRLRALHGDATAENEIGHAIDARLLGGLGLPRDALDVILARQALAHALDIEASCGGGRKEHAAVGQIAAFREIEFHQPLLHARCLFARPQY